MTHRGDTVVREVDQSQFAEAHAQGHLVVDVRDAAEYAEGHVPGAQSVPLAVLGERAARLPAGEPVYVVCASGNRSKVAAELLVHAGMDAYSVAGGTRGWLETGRPVDTGTAPA
jgi:rhodanese-related sulfurtransferase